MNGGSSPSSVSFLAQGAVAEAGVGGYEISVWSKTLGERSPAFPGGEQVQPFKCRRNGRGLVVFSEKEETAERCSRTKTHGSWNRSFNVSRTR